VGVLKLIEYEQAKRYGQPVRGIGVGGVFLILLLVGFGMTATQVSRLNWKGIGSTSSLVTMKTSTKFLAAPRLTIATN